MIVGPHQLAVRIHDADEDGIVLLERRRVGRDDELVRDVDRAAERHLVARDRERRRRHARLRRLVAPAAGDGRDRQHREGTSDQFHGCRHYKSTLDEFSFTKDLSTTEDTEDAEESLVLLCVLRVLRGGEVFRNGLNGNA
jgi:hypothetical protein